MKVFYTHPQVAYGGGIVLVAANNPEEALHVAATDERLSYAFTEWDCDLGKNVETCNTYYEWEDFREVEGLSFDTNKPKVILSNFYAE